MEYLLKGEVVYRLGTAYDIALLFWYDSRGDILVAPYCNYYCRCQRLKEKPFVVFYGMTQWLKLKNCSANGSTVQYAASGPITARMELKYMYCTLILLATLVL